MALDLILGKTKRNWSRNSTIGDHFFASSRDAAAALDQLNADVDNLNMDITQIWFPRVQAQGSTVFGGFVNAWIKWRDATYAAINDGRANKLIPDWSKNVMDRVDVKTRELAAWRKQFEVISKTRASGPQSSAPPPEAPGSGTSIWMYVALAAAGAAGAGLLLAKIK